MLRIRFLVAGLLLAGGACSRQAALSVDNGYIRLNAVPGRPAAGYFTIHGGPADVTLLSVTSPVSVKSELHESMHSGNMAAMKPIGDFPVRARSSNIFAPGGRHLMLFDVNPGIKPGRVVTLSFTFSNGQRINLDAPTIPAGAPAPDE